MGDGELWLMMEVLMKRNFWSEFSCEVYTAMKCVIFMLLIVSLFTNPMKRPLSFVEIIYKVVW